MSTLGANSTIASIRPANGGFFGNILSDISEGLGRVSQDVLPNWVARELLSQDGDQLRQDLYYEHPDRPSVDKDQTIQKATLFPANLLERTLFDIGTVSVTGNTVMIIGLIVIGGILAVKLMK